MAHYLRRLLTEPAPIQKLCQVAIREAGIGSYSFRRSIGAVKRPQYSYIVWQAASLACKLGLPRVSIVEFGVAAGSGLLNLEYHAEQIERLLPVKIDIYGFDAMSGLPPPADYRDLPYHWQSGFFTMDFDALKFRLKRSNLILGNVRDTVPTFLNRSDVAPIGAVSFDLDYYSSTLDAFRIFDMGAERLLPRAFCYFDDTVEGEGELHNDFTGERLAIHEFNKANESMKLTVPYYLRSAISAPVWHHKIWILHDFLHPLYNRYVNEGVTQFALPG